MKRAFSGPDAHERYERAGHFLLASVFDKTASRMWCDRKGVTVAKAASEGIGSGGAFLVPTEWETAILDLRDTYGAFRRRACVWPMSSDSAIFPRRTGTGSTAYFLSENTAATGDQLVVDGVNLTTKKLGALVTLSSELDQDSIYDLVDYVTNEMAWAFANKEDSCAFIGDGTSTYAGMRGVTQIALDGNHGIAKVTAATGHNTFATITDADLALVQSAVRASAMPRAAWFMSVTGFAQGLLTGITSGFLEYDLVDGVRTPMFNGFPVILTQVLPLVATTLTGKAMLVFGDMYAGAVLGQRRGLTIARSDQRYLDTDQIAILATERFDAVVHDVGDNVNAGSLAVLCAP